MPAAFSFVPLLTLGPWPRCRSCFIYLFFLSLFCFLVLFMTVLFRTPLRTPPFSTGLVSILGTLVASASAQAFPAPPGEPANYGLSSAP